MTDPRLFLPLIRHRAAAADDRASRLGPNVIALRELPARATPHASVTVRLAVAGDGPQLLRLADLDSAPALAAPVLLGERAGRAVAALSLADDAVVADPFAPTADVVDLLRLRARQLRRDAPSSRMPGRGLLGWRLARVRGG